jgi:hypothetical protein
MLPAIFCFDDARLAGTVFFDAWAIHEAEKAERKYR